MLAEIVPDSSNSMGKDLGVNKLLRSFLLDENQSLVFNLLDLPDSISEGGMISCSTCTAVN